MTAKTTRRHTAVAPVRVFDAPDGHDVIIEGRLDVHTVPDIRDAVHAVIARGRGEVRLHLGDAEIGDATGLGVILHLHRRATRAERVLTLVDPSDRTTRLLRGCRLDRILAHRFSAPPARGATPVHETDRHAATLRSGTVSPLTA